MNKIALTIAGSDPSGGAGLQADLKTFQAFDVYGTSVTTLITAQNTQDFFLSEPLSEKVIEAQLAAVLASLPPNAAKLGALGATPTLQLLAREMPSWDFPVIVDPVLKSTLGGELMEGGGLDYFKEKIVPHTSLITPNLEEASILTGIKVENINSMKEAAKALVTIGAKSALVTGGHLTDTPNDLFFDGENFEIIEGKRIGTESIHGTGCTFSAAITALLAFGIAPLEAVKQAKRYVELAIQNSLTSGEGMRLLKHDISSR